MTIQKSSISILMTVAVFMAACSSHPARQFEKIVVEAPFPMDTIKVMIYPDKDFLITEYRAVEGGETINTAAIAAAVDACNKAGGGRVIVPAGVWLTGPVHFKSNVNLHLEEDAVLSFTDNPEDYLPAVKTSWEGLECYNYSPLVYGYECENIAITGSGMLQPRMDTWKVWFKRPEPHMNALVELHEKAVAGVPVEERQMAAGENNLRPHLIHFNRCKTSCWTDSRYGKAPSGPSTCICAIAAWYAIWMKQRGALPVPVKSLPASASLISGQQRCI